MHFAPWRSRGMRFWFFCVLLLMVLGLPLLATWLFSEWTPLSFIDPSDMLSKYQDGFYARIGYMDGFLIVQAWAWWAVVLWVPVFCWILTITSIYLLRLNLLRLGLLEQVYLTPLNLNRAAMGTVAWGALIAALIVLSGFLFQLDYLVRQYPAPYGSYVYRGTTAWGGQGVVEYEIVPFGVGYCCLLLVSSMAVWHQALRGALRQASLPWLEAPRCLAAGFFVVAVLLFALAMLDLQPHRYYSRYNQNLFTLSNILIAILILSTMASVQFFTLRHSAGRICFGPVNPEIFVRDDWWESERAHRKTRLSRAAHSSTEPTSIGDWFGQVIVSFSGVSLALFVLSIMAMNVDLLEMTTRYPYVVALMGIYAPAAVAVFEAIRGPLGNRRPARGRLIRSTVVNALPILMAIGCGLCFFMWISAGLNDSRYQELPVDMVMTVAFGVGFGLLAHVALVPKHGRKVLLVGAGVVALALLVMPLFIAGIALFGAGLAAICSLPSGLMSLLFQRIHDELPTEGNSPKKSHLEAAVRVDKELVSRIPEGAIKPP